ncbi:class I SAM-dependent methyltransferase [Candidatus Omnitrophota bacterium]
MKMKEVELKVKNFYEELPFNFRGTADSEARRIRKCNAVEIYSDLDRLLKRHKNQELLDVGCGTGWFTNSIGHHYQLKAYGIDICIKAIERAKKVSEILGISQKSRFVNCSLFEMAFLRKFKFVNSLGCLHHTRDLNASLLEIAGFVERGGYIYIGLYHKYGRQPFLELFKGFREKLQNSGQLDSVEIREARSIFKSLNPQIKDELFLDSWFRDQVLHPHETQHTFKELFGILKTIGFKVISTSINQFKPITQIKELFEKEKEYFEISREKNLVSKIYFPGFFTVLAERL